MAELHAAWTQLDAVLDRPGVELYRITLTLRAHKEDDQWAALCDELGVHTCGDSLDEVMDNIVEATMCYLNTIEELGERARIFKERGIEPQLWIPETEPAPPETTSVRPGEFVTQLVAASEPDDPQLVG